MKRQRLYTRVECPRCHKNGTVQYKYKQGVYYFVCICGVYVQATERKELLKKLGRNSS